MKKPTAKKPAAKKPTAKKTVAKAAGKKPIHAPIRKPAKPKVPVAKRVAAKPIFKKPKAKPLAKLATIKSAPKKAQPKPPAKATPAPTPQAPHVFAPTPRPTPTPPPPTAQAYVAVSPRPEISYGQTMVPQNFLADGLGASIGPLTTGGATFWRVSYFGHVADFFPYQKGAIFDGAQVTLPAAPIHINSVLYLPWQPLANFLGVKWSLVKPNDSDDDTMISATPARDVMLLQYPAAWVRDVRHTVYADRTRVVMQLSNATRVVAARKGLDVQFFLAAARAAGVPAVHAVKDYLVPRAVVSSGNWSASLAVRINYAAPVRWFTLGSPPRLVVDLQRLFEEQNTNSIGGGLSLTQINKGTPHGPVKMYVVRADPREGWRLRVAPAGYSILQRNRPSLIAQRNNALVAVNGGFFAYDGAAVGAVLVDGEWLRLPWKGRTAIGFTPDGGARIGNMQTRATVKFSSGLEFPLRDLNGWPDTSGITALTRRFSGYYKLRPGQIALVVRGGKVVSKPGSGGVPIYGDGFTLIAGIGAAPYLNAVARGDGAVLDIQAQGWDDITSALGGGPRLLNNGRVEVTALREAFRADVRVGLGPRTALGLDAQGRYIIAVVDGRQPYRSTGLTLTEMAQTMQKLGAIDAMGLDGGGSSAIAVRQRVINRPSDGVERSVANALLVMR